jgi:hypothetical protein
MLLEGETGGLAQDRYLTLFPVPLELEHYLSDVADLFQALRERLDWNPGSSCWDLGLTQD